MSLGPFQNNLLAVIDAFNISRVFICAITTVYNVIYKTIKCGTHKTLMPCSLIY